MPKGWVIHHIDGNGWNNDLSNLSAMTIADHNTLHAKLRRERKDPVDETDPAVLRHRQQSRDSKRHNYPKNKDKILAQNRKYRLEHKEMIREYNKKYHILHKDELAIRSKQWRAEHKDEISLKAKQRYAEKKLLAKQ